MPANKFGSVQIILLTLCLGLPSLSAEAALFASLDRYRIAMGDTVRLTLRSDDDSDPGDADLSGLREHFDVLERSSSVSTRMINGQRSQSRELILEITPQRQGSIVIPPFTVDGKRSEALAVEVGPEPQAKAADEIVTFEAEIDRDTLYVQGQLLLTLRVQQAVNLESRSITELDIAGAFVETLGQNSFQRMIDGRPWLVHEIRYAIFPEASGKLVIPAQTFSGRMGAGRRTLFDTRPAGRLIRRRTEAIAVTVAPRPAEFPDSTWLPAAELTIEERWSAPLDELRIGDSVTRIISVTADGLQGAQLPPIEGNGIDGLRAYPDQPVINNVNGDNGITGVRTDSLALVAVGDGDYELPAVEVPWWDTSTDTLRIARLPPRRLRVLPNAVTSTTETLNATQVPTPATATAHVPGLWPWITAFCALGWLLTSLWWWRSARRSEAKTEAPTERSSPKALLNACRANDAKGSRRELLAWVRGQGSQDGLGPWLREQQNPALEAAVRELETALYGGEAMVAWDGEALATAIRAANTQAMKTGEDASALPPLYLSQ